MSENNNKFGGEDNGRMEGQKPDREWNGSGQSPESESNSSYYYSYGPFKSINHSEPNSGSEEHYVRREPERVEVTPPQPVKPVPYPSIRPTGYGGGYGGNGTGGPGGNDGGWQYNQNRKPKKPVRTAVISFLAGMLVLSGSMFAADKGNWFTGNQEKAATAALSQGEAANESANVKPSTTTTKLVTGSNGVSGVVDEAGPAVVKIETLVKTNSRSSQSNPNMSDPFYQFFFGDQYGGNSSGSQQNNGSSGSGSSGSDSQLTPYGIGTGFIYDKAGYILTNEHVIENADVIQVTVDGNSKPYEAKLLGSSKDLDLAVLKIEGDNNFSTVPLGDSDAIKVGAEVVAIGNPQGFDHTVTAGVLSAKGRSIDINEEDGSGTRNYTDLLQTDASINPGNSGGPLLDESGQVIGMNVAVSTDSQGIGFAIPVNKIKEVVDKLEANQAIPKEPVPFIGASLMTITDEVAKQMGTDIKEGSVVAEIIYKSPAYVADLRPYDIITGINGTKYATSQELIDFIKTKKVGDKITLNVVRDGKKLDLPVTIGNKNDFDTTKTQSQSQQ